MEIIISVILSTAIATFAMIAATSRKMKGEKISIDLDSEQAVIEAKVRAKEVELEARNRASKTKTDAENYVRGVKERAYEAEKKWIMKLSQLEVREKDLSLKAVELEKLKKVLVSKKEEVVRLVKNEQERLEKIASLTKDEAKKQLLESLEKELIQEKGKRIREFESELREESERIAKDILVNAMRYGATDYVVEHSVYRVKLPDEEMTGRIIGKEGRNIRKFEEVTGVELELDSSPGEVLVSSFDPVRREIARITLERLIADGRIQPARIEAIAEKTAKEIDSVIFKEGDNLCHRLGVYKLPGDLVYMLGKFKYRFSYGQNMIEHTLEETRIGASIARELGVNVETVKLGCLFHDIGKIVDKEEGTHIQLGVDLLKRHKLPQAVIDCVAEHHEDKPFSSIESAIVNLADHISGARPGARAEDYEEYVKRMQELEGAALSFDGVEKAYAISAGREVRVFVKPEIVDDDSTAFLAREIAKKIELEQTYPGTVKVTAIRETRVTETAK